MDGFCLLYAVPFICCVSKPITLTATIDYSKKATRKLLCVNEKKRKIQFLINCSEVTQLFFFLLLCKTARFCYRMQLSIYYYRVFSYKFRHIEFITLDIAVNF